jgi:hypothetical protein
MSHQLIIHFAGFLIDVNQFSPALKPSCSAVVLISTLFRSGQKCRMVLDVSHAIVNSAGRSPTNATCVATQRLVGYAKIANPPYIFAADANNGKEFAASVRPSASTDTH